MASTIIIKNGAGSSTPSSLKQGEFAINVDNGKLFYGTSGSSNAVSSSFSFQHITASGNISASGTIFGNEINVNGGIFTSASLAAAQASGDNLGNHTATQNLNLANFDITSSKSIIGITGSFNQAVVTLKAGAQESPFLITIANSNGQDNKLEMTKDGTLKFGALNTLPTAITGGLVYSASAFYMGL
tara:strand:- start:188 stop:748 length:561 start_codon:yes stop_codon:yes gene_type:complete